MSQTLVWTMILFGVVGLALGCSAHQASSGDEGPHAGNGLLKGHMSIGPLRPVERVGEVSKVPPEMYRAHKIVISKPDGHEVKKVVIDDNGNYSVELPPGSYVVDFTPHDIGIRAKMQKGQTVTIEADKTAVVNFDLDTGIR